ncbi:peptide ABC transporter substrate-binding protein [Clostridium botulinum]|uniref:Peptide ABC transporter substrate-binding protein n=1 Tax=Clostridium botulinum C/D str. DC5 TaxID=1443128 RepID=A0A0A0I7Y6_CLOBO|nr:ABC transporter substrate-binding protein [Clostridium botulinum]KEI05577.1 peptide ABC transporter substrate-binding protein [Clostridium botulinum C/D str. BKT75002]KEI09668.1 peptide ABC transporter substrate-binding protein [Clostridium botulinum C/D str. BKT2873]KGM96411.1 peptide ABC transporter substrate-binding protein [Clostridium botulinum C/D str. DC5]MCD3235233.1 peptide ABC transporter substrate-binding protein [Clostridium botulinum D/C]MCD3240578.1 peptide ABC transporter sub
MKVKRRFIGFTIIFAMIIIFMSFHHRVDYDFFRKNTKSIVFAIGTEPITLDPKYAEDIESAKVIVNIYDGLVRYKENSTEVEPSLATNWDISEDERKYTFYLRKGVKFHDGTEFNAYSVRESIIRQLNFKEASTINYFKRIFKNLININIIDDYTVKIILKDKDSQFLSNLAMPYSAPIVSPKAIRKYGDKYFKHPVGTGAFKFVSWKKGEAIVLKKNNNYWGEKAKVERIVFTFIKKNPQRVAKFMTKDVDVVDNLDSTSIMDIEKAGGKILQQKGDNINYVKFNYLKYPLNNLNLRRAICSAINREKIMKKFYNGYSTIIKDGILYNPQLSIKTLQELNLDNLSIKMIIYSNPTSYNTIGERLSEYVQQNLLEVGIKATIEVFPWDKYHEKISQGDWDIMFYGCIGEYECGYIKEVSMKNNICFPICNLKMILAYSDKILGLQYHTTGVVFFNKVSIKE